MTFNYGEPISVELSEYLKDFTDTQSIADVSTKTGISISTLKYLKLRSKGVFQKFRANIALHEKSLKRKRKICSNILKVQ